MVADYEVEIEIRRNGRVVWSGFEYDTQWEFAIGDATRALSNAREPEPEED